MTIQPGLRPPRLIKARLRRWLRQLVNPAREIGSALVRRRLDRRRVDSSVLFLLGFMLTHMECSFCGTLSTGCSQGPA